MGDAFQHERRGPCLAAVARDSGYSLLITHCRPARHVPGARPLAGLSDLVYNAAPADPRGLESPQEMPVSAVFKKLNLKDQSMIVVIDAPASFEPELATLEGIVVQRTLDAVGELAFSLAFVTRQEQIDALADQIAAKARGDAVVWFAYPKGSSKRYRCDFNRDRGWDALGAAGFEPVRQVAIDEDWSALRFRRVEYIKTMTRTTLRPLSQDGQQRVAENAQGADS